MELHKEEGTRIDLSRYRIESAKGLLELVERYCEEQI